MRGRLRAPAPAPHASFAGRRRERYGHAAMCILLTIYKVSTLMAGNESGLAARCRRLAPLPI
ncbi:protein of unknown function [Burkholderia multivorans]